MILALDTATEIMSIALSDAGKLRGERNMIAGRSHLEMLLPEIYKLLSSCGLEFGEIEAIVAGVGPGTFSGLRVGVATARALAQALKLPAASSCSLDALAIGLAEDMQPEFSGLLPLIDARRGQVFTCAYRIGHDRKPVAASAVVCIDPEDVHDFVTVHIDGRALAGGNGLRAYAERLPREGLDYLPPDDSHNDIRAANHLPYADFVPYSGPEGLADIEPLYVREPDADKTILLRKREPWFR